MESKLKEAVDRLLEADPTYWFDRANGPWGYACVYCGNEKYPGFNLGDHAPDCVFRQLVEAAREES